MDKTIPQCQLLLFIATSKSVFDSKDCQHELELARQHDIQILPIKGTNVDWGDLAEVGLSRELGLEFNVDDFDKFCEDLYQYIYEFKRNIDLIDKEQGKIDKIMLETENLISKFLKSPDNKDLIKDNISKIYALKQGLQEEKISFLEYMDKFWELFKE